MQFPLPRRLRRKALFLGIAALGLFWLHGAARGEPYLAVRYGYKCSQCHFNPSGGGKRNSFGTIFSQTELPARTLTSQDFQRLASFAWPAQEGMSSEGEENKSENTGSPQTAESSSPGWSTFYGGYVADFLSLGGDFRFTNRSIFRGGDHTKSNSFDVSEGNLYGALEFFNGGLNFYLDETVAPGGAAAREAYALLKGPWTSYLKAGRMMLPYGLRLQDDTAFVREITGFNYGVQDLGLELGWEPGPLSMQFAISNGSQGSTDDNRDKQATGQISFIQRYWRFGTHATWNNTSNAKRIAVGGSAGVNLGRFTLVGEIDHILDDLRSLPGAPSQRQLLLYGAVHCLVVKGLNLVFSYDFADPDLSESDDTFIRVSAGVEHFITQFVQFRAFYRFRDDVNTSSRDNESVLDFELHLFF